MMMTRCVGSVGYLTGSISDLDRSFDWIGREGGLCAAKLLQEPFVNRVGRAGEG